MPKPTVGEVLGEAGLLLLIFLAAILAVEILTALYMEFI